MDIVLLLIRLQPINEGMLMIHTTTKLLVLLSSQVRIGLKRKKREEVTTLFFMMLDVRTGTSTYLKYNFSTIIFIW